MRVTRVKAHTHLPESKHTSITTLSSLGMELPTINFSCCSQCHPSKKNRSINAYLDEARKADTDTGQFGYDVKQLGR
ncbi:hypothetical protein SK128_023306, partial [Halocaridina rubra]